MPGKTAASFLRRTPPFGLLDEQALNRFVEGLTMQLYPAGAHILQQGSPPTRELYVIKEGLVRLYARTPAGQDQVLDFRSAGDTFGFLSLGEGDRLEASVQAVSDTVCYVADGASALKLLEDHPELQEYLLPRYYPKREGDLPRANIVLGAPHEGGERVLFTTPVAELARREVLAVRADTPAIEAARLMSAQRVGASVVVDEIGLPVGLLTNTDLRDRVFVAGRDPAVPAGEVMSAPPLAVQAGDFCFEALLKMLGHGVHHLLVLDGERLAGVVSSHDFMVLQGTSPLVIAREIEGRTTVEGLAASSRRVKSLVSLLLREGAGAGTISRVLSAVNDRLEIRVLELVLQTLGPPPLPFCWIVYGSAGRKEQTFKTDQDNAIVYRDPADEREAAAAQEYFSRFAELAVDAFLRCGFSRCQGNFMASNPEWRQPLRVWNRSFSDWIRNPTGDAVYQAANLFDFRGLHGDLRLAAELKGHLLQALRGQPIFLKAMADDTFAHRPPLGMLGTLVVETAGEHANQLDIKRHCLMPLVNIARLFSLECRIAETSTLERLAVLAGVHPVVKTDGADLAHAFEFLSLLRIRHQHERIAMDLEPDNFIHPGQLSSLNQHALKQICRLLTKIIVEIQRKYSETTRI
jgi:CBS domain-containing protein